MQKHGAGGATLSRCLRAMHAWRTLYGEGDSKRNRPRTGKPLEHFRVAFYRANFEKAQRDLQALGIEFRLSNHKVCDSLYLNDPEGHQIELTTYEV